MKDEEGTKGTVGTKELDEKTGDRTQKSGEREEDCSHLSSYGLTRGSIG